MEFRKSNIKNKKYDVLYNGKWISFGDRRYSQYFDKVPLHLYSNLNHGDPVLRANYLARAKGIKDKEGKLTYKNKNSPNYWSVHFLW